MALKLVDVQDGKITLVEETVQILQERFRETQKNHVIGMIGQARKGKGTTATYLLHRLGVNITGEQRFISRSGGRSVTIGIWVWPQPISVNEEKKETLMILDCQGSNIGNETINVQLATLVCMMSSLIVFHMEGAINEEQRNLLHVLDRFSSKLVGSDQERKLFIPKLLIRSREYRKDDFKMDFPELAPNLSLQEVKQSLDQKLEHLLRYEVVDRDIKHASLSICETFRERHWFVTWNTTPIESKLLQTQYVLPLDEDKKSDFRQSMSHFIDYILELSEPKLIQESNISMTVLISCLGHFISRLEDEKNTLHIPTVVEMVQQQEIEHFLQHDLVLKYEEMFLGREAKNLEELKEIHEQVKEDLIRFYQQQCQSKNLSNWIIERNNETLNLVIETCFLGPEEKLREHLSQRILDLKTLADRDHKRQEELGVVMEQMQNQIQNISSQISTIQSETSKSDLLLKQALQQRDQAQNEYNRSKRSSSFLDNCIIL